MPHRTASAVSLCVAAVVLLAGCGSRGTDTGASARPPRTSTPATSATPSPSQAPPATSPAPASSAPTRYPTPSIETTPSTTPTTSHTRAAPARLPLSSGTGSAKQVITVVAASRSSTTATVQAWSKTGNRWARVGPSVTGNLGSDGLSAHASESRSATPIGSFTLTQAFGAKSNPGTALAYRHTDAADWWISQPGPLYNTRQHCSKSCSFTRADPNEHLFYETPAYDYAVVIDYNTPNAPGGVRQGRGSAFFLHVSEGVPTAGCVSIPRAALTRIMRWLDPHQNPRILIGT